MKYLIKSVNRNKSIYTSFSNFRYTLKQPVICNSCIIHNWSIYNTSYNVNTNNNKYYIIYNNTTYNITIPEGNYSTTSLATALQVELNATNNNVVYTVTYDSKTFKYTITASQSTTFNLVGALFGFNSILTGTSITAQAIAFCSVTPYYLLVFKNLPIDNYLSDLQYHVFIDNNVPTGSLNSNTRVSVCDATVVIRFSETTLTHLDIVLYDYNGNIVSLNSDFSLEIELHNCK